LPTLYLAPLKFTRPSAFTIEVNNWLLSKCNSARGHPEGWETCWRRRNHAYQSKRTPTWPTRLPEFSWLCTKVAWPKPGRSTQSWNG
jgi:hypothetical protein